MRLSTLALLFLSSTLASASRHGNGNDCKTIARYTVVSGDTLNGIAQKFNLTLTQIEFVNPAITNPDFITVGEVIKITTPSCNPPASFTAPATATAATATCEPSPASSTYTVKSGDTFTTIASGLGISLDALEGANPGIDFDTIAIGQVIKVPVCTT